MFSLTTKLLAGFLLASVLALGVLGHLYRAEVREGAATRAAWTAAVAANKTNLATIERMESDIIINEAKAIADALDRRELEGDARDLQGAIDTATEGDCPNPALDALRERRRLQLERDRNRDRDKGR